MFGCKRMINAQLTADEVELVARAASFTRRVIAPASGEWEQARATLPRAVIRDWVGLGLNALQVSPSRGGSGASYACKLAVAEILAAGDFAAAFALINMQGLVTRIEREGSQEQIDRYLPGLMHAELICAPSLSEPGAGSDFAAITTRATKVPGGWRIDGEKAWITNGAVADLLVMYAQTDPSRGADGIASFLINLHAPGITRLPPYALIGGHAIGAAGIRLERVEVPDRDLFAVPGLAFKRALVGVTGARIHVAAMVCGMVANALKVALNHANQRETFGRKLLEHQGLRWLLVDVATQLEAARLLTARAGEIYATGADAQLEAAQAKKFTADLATPAITACMQAMGAEGLRVEHPLGRHLAGARIATLVDGSTEIQNERIGRALLARYAGA
jgi:alkylation response protein AidB-like acyl-CoA dehydrogenase